MLQEGIKIVTNNKKAFFEYFLSDFIECGISLQGTEIKSLRMNGCSLADSYVTIKKGEVFVLGMHIVPYEKGNIFNHDPKRKRKLLLHKKEILKLEQKVKEKGFTLVATKVYLSKGKAKVEIALGKGKKLFDKRESQKQKDVARENEKYGKIR